MIRRSTPPASAALADSPVPAPAPMIGRPAAAVFRSPASAVLRSMSAFRIVGGDELVQPLGGLPPEAGVVDRGVHLMHDDRGTGEAFAEGGEAGLVGFGVAERPARD